MAKGKNGPGSGSDASYIEPKFVPNDKLLPRDDSGGPDASEFQHSADWDEGGRIVGDKKPHLSA
jgi:hypothetical protein